MEKILDKVVKKINARLKEIDMTGKDFSRKMGKNPNWLTALKHVQNDILVKDLIKACQILKMNPSTLLSSNFSPNICDMKIDELIEILVKKKLDEYLKSNKKISKLLEHMNGEAKDE